MKAQSTAASTSGMVRVPHIPVGADASSSAAASEAITDTSSVAGKGVVRGSCWLAGTRHPYAPSEQLGDATFQGLQLLQLAHHSYGTFKGKQGRRGAPCDMCMVHPAFV